MATIYASVQIKPQVLIHRDEKKHGKKFTVTKLCYKNKGSFFHPLVKAL